MRESKKIYDNLDALYQALAKATEDLIRVALAHQERFNLVLAGGNTPRGLYQRWADRPAGSLPWEKIHLYWGDERFVPHTSEESNFLMVKQTLLDNIQIPEANIHPITTGTERVEQGAAAYEKHLQAEFSEQLPRLDLILLGIGSDGHTASLFPGSPVLEEAQRWVGTSKAPREPRERITLTYPVLNNARVVYFLASGARKADAVRNACTRDLSEDACPAAFVQPKNGDLIFWLDRDAAQLLPAD